MFKGFADQHEIIIVINNIVKIYLQVKKENKTPLIPVFQVIFEDQQPMFGNICTKIFE